MASWELQDLEKQAKAYPNSFFIPSLSERKAQKTGDLVKLHFLLKNPGEGEPEAERMWVKVTKEKGLFGKYKGFLDNDPYYIKDLKAGDEIEFGPEHIGQVPMKKEDPWSAVDSYEKQALVSTLCLDAKEKLSVRFLYREKPDNEQDSGWRMFYGGETDEFNSDPAHIRLMNVGFLLNKDPTLLGPLSHKAPCAFERTEMKLPWTEVKDWAPAE